MDMDEKGMTRIRWSVFAYQVYLFLGMQHGQLAQQPRITDAIIRHFADEKYFSEEDVMLFWRRCKNDDVFTRKIMRLVVGCALRAGEDLEDSMAGHFERDVKLKALWDELIEPMRKRLKERKQQEQQEQKGENQNSRKDVG
jgi:hypothetical protein